VQGVSENGTGTIHFSVFELDVRAGELRRNGSRIRLQEQPFQVLLTLLERPGEVISRDELRTKLWTADTFVDFDHSLNAAVRRLRDALGDSAETPRFVETVARRGYRFIAPVQKPTAALAIPSAHPKLSHSRRWWLAIAGSVALLAVGIVAGFHAGRSASGTRTPVARRLTANPAELPVLGHAISADGKYLAFADASGFYIRQIDTGETHALSLPKGFDSRPAAWFPDGTHLLATWVEDPRKPASIWQLSVVGGEPRKLIDEGRSPSISPDGSQIALVAGPETRQEIWIAQSDGQRAHRLSTTDGSFVGQIAWSPNLKRIAYVSGKYRHDWYPETRIETINLADGQRRVLLTQTGLGPGLIWTPDGRLLFSAQEPSPGQDDSNVWSVRIDEAAGTIWGPRQRVTSTPGHVGEMTRSADGRRLSIAKYTLQPDVYISELRNPELRLSTPRRLTLDDRIDFPYSWTPDSKAVIFASDRDGSYHIFKQGIDRAEPELLVGGSADATLPRLSPDGSTVLFLVQRIPGDSTQNVQMMRVPLTGGPPQFVLEEQSINNHQCARTPSTLCLFSQISNGQQTFYRYDPSTGEHTEIPSAKIKDADPYAFNWSLSPDGKLLASAKKMGPEKKLVIRLLSIPDGAQRTLQVQAWAGIGSLDWSADGKSLWAMAFTTKDTWALLNISVRGTVTTVLEEKNLRLGWAIPSPDGKRLALWESSGSANVWMVENF
jgi:Tol biopolymer transport system component/DNA-binding winged helix-turn-helix (wHTH) protein